MRSSNTVDDKTTRKARLRRIGRFLARPVYALNRARACVQRRRRHSVAQSCTVSAGESTNVSPVSIEDPLFPLLDVSKGYVGPHSFAPIILPSFVDVLTQVSCTVT
jgi:hypothetical protein